MRRMIATVALTFGPVAAAAQQEAPVPILLLLQGSTRAMGLGGAYDAAAGGDVVFYNPAQVGEVRQTAIAWQRFDNSAALFSLATTTSAIGVSLGAGVQYLEYTATSRDGGITTGALAHGGTFTASGVAGVLSAAIERNGVRIGLSTKYLAQTVASGRRSMPTMDLGFATDLGPVTVAMVLHDADGVLAKGAENGFRLPTRVSFSGMAARMPVGLWFDLGAAASVTIDKNGEVRPAGGIELSYLPVSGWEITGRIGAQDVSGAARRGESAMTFGATLGVDRIALDYAFQQYDGPGATHRIGLRVR